MDRDEHDLAQSPRKTPIFWAGHLIESVPSLQMDMEDLNLAPENTTNESHESGNTWCKCIDVEIGDPQKLRSHSRLNVC